MLKMTRWLLIALLLCPAVLPGCSMIDPPVETIAARPLGGYRLGPGEHLRIIVFGHEDLSGEFFVDPAGYVAMPLIKNVKAAGLTANDLAQSITDKLQPDYLLDPKVSVEILDYRPIYILGEVRTPGKYPYVPNMTVLQAVAVAGGDTYRAREDRAEVTRPIHGYLKTFDVGTETVIEPGDTIVVKRRWF